MKMFITKIHLQLYPPIMRAAAAVTKDPPTMISINIQSAQVHLHTTMDSNLEIISILQQLSQIPGF